MILNNEKNKNFQSNFLKLSKLSKFGNKKILPILKPSADSNILARFAKLCKKKEKSKKYPSKSQSNKDHLNTKEISKSSFKNLSFDKKLSRSNKFSSNFINRSWKKRETPQKKKERLFAKWSKYDIAKFRLNISRRFRKKYKFLSVRDHLIFNLIIKPNNVFSTISTVCTTRDSSKKTLISELSKVKSANSSTYKIKFSKRGIKGKVLAYLRSFLKNLRFLKVKRFGFAVLNITCPKFLRKHILSSISKFFLSKKFLNKEVIVQIKDMKVFNGCVARKQRRKKRKKFVLYK